MTRGYKKTYTRSAYNRPAMMGRDFVYEAINTKSCLVCGKKIERNIYKSGVEQISHWLKRKYCSRVCYKKSLFGKTNPKWRGGKPKCFDCGNETSWYPNINPDHYNPQKLCQNCYLKHSTERFKALRKETVFIKCKKCGILTTNRYPCGKINYSKNRFCSIKCANSR